jgi:hypothetical protein
MDRDRDSIEDNLKQPKGNIAQTSLSDEWKMDSVAQSRRSVLRGIFAVGCSLLLSAALLGSQDASADTAAPAAKKVSKASVHYQTHPNGEKRCGTCVNFISASNTCKRVEGQVNPKGYCILWTKSA